MVLLFKSCGKKTFVWLKCYITSDKSVLESNKDDEDGIENRKSYDEIVEGAGHLFCWEDGDCQDIPEEAK